MSEPLGSGSLGSGSLGSGSLGSDSLGGGSLGSDSPLNQSDQNNIIMQCRFCKTELDHVFIDLVNSPASNSFLTQEQLNEPEAFYPLKVYTCHNCFLVQVDEYKR